MNKRRDDGGREEKEETGRGKQKSGSRRKGREQTFTPLQFRVSLLVWSLLRSRCFFSFLYSLHSTRVYIN